MKVKQAVHCQNILGEGPLWVSDENALYWVDIDGKKIQRFAPGDGGNKVYDLPLKASVIVPREKGGFVLGTENGFFFWDEGMNQLNVIIDPEQGKAGARFNDGKVDPAGRFWAGTMTTTDATSALYRLDPDLSVHTMIDGVTISNGIGWSPDQSCMYYVDSLRYRLYRFDFDLENGEISNRSVVFETTPDFGVPDGLTVDSEGCIWLAIYDGWQVLRITPNGKIDQRIQMPVSRPSSCTFGGDDLDLLFITSIAEGLDTQQKKEQPLAGDLFVVSPGVNGLPASKFLG